MNYQEMTDFEINKAVAVSLKESGVISKILTPVSGIPEYSAVQCIHTKYGWMWFDPCESWADAGPIIQENGISITPYGSDAVFWEAEDKYGSGKSDCDNNPLRAAMVVFLMMKGGE